jgi:hypothetical protein
MATRREVGERRQALRHEIEEGFRQGTLRPGTLVPPVRELAFRHGLSKEIAHQEVLRLVEEGVLYTVPGAGTFFGHPPTNTRAFFLFIDQMEDSAPLPLGFAQRIAALGGATLMLPIGEARFRGAEGTLPPIAGVWDSTENGSAGLPWGPERREIPRAGFITHLEDPLYMDGVGLDDLDGGRQATEHLIRMGHRRIAYLGLHPAEGAVSEWLSWSALRAEGWRTSLAEAGVEAQGLAFHPDSALFPWLENHRDTASETVVAADGAERLVQANDTSITAVVAANDRAALTLVRALRRSRVPVERWPALVGFDNLPGARGYLLSSLHRPLDQVGAAAADILWERYRSRSAPTPPQRRLVPMVLLPRVTSERGWPVRMPDAPAMLLSAGL